MNQNLGAALKCPIVVYRRSFLHIGNGRLATLTKYKFLIAALGNFVGLPPEMHAIAIVAKDARHAPTLDITVHPGLPRSDLGGEQRFGCLDHGLRPLVDLL